MIGKFLLVLVVVVLQSNADYKDRYAFDRSNFVMSRFYNQYVLGMTGRPYNTQDLYKMYLNRTPRVKIQMYYESLCPDCRTFDSGQLKNTVIALASNLDIHVYPYGNARTEERDGHVKITCQHGPPECYGNKLHACAIDYLMNITAAVLYNSCMMDPTQAGQGSDDAAADVCAQAIGINSSPIKQCAKGERGTALLKYYGEESQKTQYDYVPYILIDGKVNSGEHFMQDVCKAFSDPPPACQGLLN